MGFLTEEKLQERLSDDDDHSEEVQGPLLQRLQKLYLVSSFQNKLKYLNNKKLLRTKQPSNVLGSHAQDTHLAVLNTTLSQTTHC